jgi:hypothetical protein
MSDKAKSTPWYPQRHPITTFRRRDIPRGGNPRVRYLPTPFRGTSSYRIPLPPDD